MAITSYAKPEVLVTTEWLAAHLDDPKLRIIEIDVDRESYLQGHIPGAVGWDWSKELGAALQRDIPSAAEFEALLSKNGINANDTLILYGDNNNWFAAYGFWLLKIYGHKDVRILDGGRKKWLAEGRTVTQEVTAPAKTSYTAKDNRTSELRAFREDVLAEMAPGKSGLVDVRSPAEFTGEIISPPGLPETAQRGGHIPGARSIPWGLACNEDGTFKSAGDLTALYQGHGISPDKPVIAYCRIGERSAHTWFVLSHLLGYPHVKNYDGSWTEWGNIVGSPIEKGEAAPVR